MIYQQTIIAIVLSVVVLVLPFAPSMYAQDAKPLNTKTNPTVQIAFETSPRGASIKLDNAVGEFSCPQTPCTLEIPIGDTYMLTVSKKGYKTKQSGERYRPVAIGQSIHSILLTPETSTSSPADRFGLYTYEKQGLCKIAAQNANKVNQEATPCYRIPGIMPPRAERSGTCSFKYDITAEGLTQNITILSCSEEMFADPTITAVEKWKYVPAVKNGVTMAVVGAESNMTYRLTDYKDRIIPMLGSE